MDRAACDRLGIPWYIFGENDEWTKLEPKEELRIYWEDRSSMASMIVSLS